MNDEIYGIPFHFAWKSLTSRAMRKITIILILYLIFFFHNNTDSAIDIKRMHGYRVNSNWLNLGSLYY